MLHHGRRVIASEPAAALPDLDGRPDEAYANVLCNAVPMHLPAERRPPPE